MSTPERLAARLEQLLAAEQREKRLVGIAAAVLRDGELIWESAAGMADVEGGVEATPDTQFRCGSITRRTLGQSGGAGVVAAVNSRA